MYTFNKEKFCQLLKKRCLDNKYIISNKLVKWNLLFKKTKEIIEKIESSGKYKNIKKTERYKEIFNDRFDTYITNLLETDYGISRHAKDNSEYYKMRNKFRGELYKEDLFPEIEIDMISSDISTEIIKLWIPYQKPESGGYWDYYHCLQFISEVLKECVNRVSPPYDN